MKTTYFQIALLSLLSISTSIAQTFYPDMQNVAKPNPEPTLPSGIDPFQPPVSTTSAVVGTPTFAEWTKTGNPESTLALTGDEFSALTGTSAGSDTVFQVFGQNAGGSLTARATNLRLDGVKAAIELPPNLPKDSEYLIWPMNAAGSGYPIAVNATESWWVGPSLVTRGDSVSMYGRNLVRQATGLTAYVYIQQSGLAGVWATVTAANPYKVDFKIPAGLANGDYQVWVHNGRGGHYGWSGPQNLTVNDGLPWTSQVFNVKSYGAKGNGVADDQAAIETAMLSASKVPWSTLYFPAGTYMVSRGFPPPSRSRWIGDGATKSIIKANDKFVKPATYDGRAFAIIFNDAYAAHITFQDLAIDANNNLNGYLSTPVRLRSSYDIHFINVTINAKDYDTADFHNSAVVSFKNCDLIGGGKSGSGVFFGTAKDVSIDGCRIYGTHDVNTMLAWWGGDRMSCTNTVAQDYNNKDLDGWAQGRFFYGASTWGSNRNIYVGDNTTRALAVRPGFGNQNSGEQCLWENSTKYTGTPTSATATTVTFPPNGVFTVTSLFNGGFDAVVTNGTGLGQHRKIASCSGTTLTISPPWNVPPNRTSTVIISGTVSRCAIYHNSFQGKSDYLTRNTASCAVSAFGSSYDFVVDSNDISQMNESMAFWGMAEDRISAPESIQCAYFNYVANNSVHNCKTGINVFSQNFTPWPANNPFPGTSFLANTFVNNSIDSVATVGIAELGGLAKIGDQFDLNIFDSNAFTNTPTTYDFSSYSKNEVVVLNDGSTGTATPTSSPSGTSTSTTSSSSSTTSGSTTVSSTTTSGTTATTPEKAPATGLRQIKPTTTQTTTPAPTARRRS